MYSYGYDDYNRELPVDTREYDLKRMARDEKIHNTRVAYGEINDYQDYIDVGEIQRGNIHKESHDFLKAKSIKPYSKFHHRVDLQLTNSDIGCPNNNGTYRYDPCQLNPKEGNDFNATVELISGSLRIPIRAFPENTNFSELSVVICESFIGYMGRDEKKYQFKMFPDFNKSNLTSPLLDQYIVFEPEHPCIPYVRWSNMSDITLEICGTSGKIVFRNPTFCNASVVVGVGLTTFTFVNHGLVDNPFPDRIRFKKCTGFTGSYPITVIDDDTFTIPIELHGFQEIDFIVDSLNFTYNVIIYTLKQDGYGPYN